MSADVETLLKHLRERTGRVELDLPSPQSAGSIEVAAQLGRERRIAISRGDRAAHLYLVPGSARSASVLVTEGEARALSEAGATWIGPELYAPKPLRTQPDRMIDRFALRDFKAHRATELELGRLTVLVGDNASGKTSVLDALALQGSIRPPIDDILRGAWSIPNLLRRGASSNQIALESSGIRGPEVWSTQLHLTLTSEQMCEVNISAQMGLERHEASATAGPSGFGHRGDWSLIRATVGTAAMYRLRAEQIAAASYSDEPEARVAADGSNTALVLAAMKLGDDDRFDIIEEAMRRLVPSLARIRIRPETFTEHVEAGGVTRRGSKIYFDFHGARDIPADGASHGTLILLSLLTALYGPTRPALVLIDDVEQALHPRAQRELVQLLKDLIARPEFSDLQIVATTHSPYVLDLLDPSDVYAFALRDDGTVASKRLSEHPDAKKMKGSLTAGQLWSLDEERNWVLR
jgi:predicted ATPase